MKKITEGKAEIFVPEESLKRKSEVFYNPVMGYQRSITVASVKIFGKKKVLDPLAGTGIRGIRLIKEALVENVTFNDINPNAVEFIKKNLKLNGISDNFYRIYQKDANILFLEKEKYDFVDIDPFGSPIKYLSNVGYSLKKESLLGVTATDSGALSGKFVEACLRRYGIFVCETDFSKELGIRVLITSILQNLARNEMTFEPIYSHGNHYFRVLGLIHYGPDKNIEKIKMVSFCPRCLNKKIDVEKICDNCGNEMKIIGPLWIGKIMDREFCKNLVKNLESGLNKKELILASEEIDSPFYYDIRKVCQNIKKNPPKMEDVINKLKENGFEASRSHLCATGIKTNAGIKNILDLIK